MRNVLKIFILLIISSSCLSVSAQKRPGVYRQKYEEAEVLANNNLYDVARAYYVEAYNDARATRQHKNIQNQIKQKIVLMDCYAMYGHLVEQARQLERMHDFESAYKYYSDALSYAAYEGLNIPNSDYTRSRIQVVGETSDLCVNLCKIERLNQDGDYAQARELYFQWVKQADSLRHKWETYEIPVDFVQKMDSVSGFLADNRNEILSYRSVFPEEYKMLDDYIVNLLNTTACQYSHPIETDVTFVVSLDTNGVIKMNIVGNKQNNDFHNALVQNADVQMLQPHRYGFALPAKEEIRYHLSSSNTSAWVEKNKNDYKVKDSKLKKMYKDEFRSQLSAAPDGKYLFLIHRNVMNDCVKSAIHITKAKGGKAKKWLKTL